MQEPQLQLPQTIALRSEFNTVEDDIWEEPTSNVVLLTVSLRANPSSTGISPAASNTKHVDGKPSLPALPTSWLYIHVNFTKLAGI